MSFRDIIAWKKAHEIVLDVYKIKYPNEEVFGIQSQIRKAAVSVANNIAEGSGRSSTKEFIHFLSISRGSLEELRYLLFLSKELNFAKNETIDAILEKAKENSKILNGLIKSLRNKNC